MIQETLKKIRSHRSFTDKKIPMEDLEIMVESTRYSSSARNAQKVRFAIVNDETTCQKIFSFVKFAGAISWNPQISEAPTAYIMLCSEKPLASFSENYLYFDMGTATHNILLTANEMGYGGCIIGAYNKLEVEKLVGLPAEYTSYFLVALGEPRDNITLVDAKDDDTTYSRTSDNQHFVPKLPLEKICLLKK